MDKMELSKSFEERCKKELPQYVKVGSNIYRVDCNMFMGSDTRYRIAYGEWNGLSWDWGNVLFDKHFEVCDVLPKIKEPEEGELIDNTTYLLDIDSVFSAARYYLGRYTYTELTAGEIKPPEPSPPFEKVYTSGYSHVVPDSQSFDKLEQILQYVKTRSDDDYLKIALQNTINNGFQLKK
jgi:hypothetical protein